MDHDAQSQLLLPTHSELNSNPPTAPPNSRYQLATPHASAGKLRHRDGLGRSRSFPSTDRGNWFLRPEDGRLTQMSVQESSRLESHSPVIVKVISWIYSGTLNDDPWDEHPPSTTKSSSVYLKWVPGSLAIMFLLFIPSNLEGEFRNGGNYDPVRHRDWLYDQVPKNVFEAMPSAKESESLPLIGKGGRASSDDEGYHLPDYPRPKNYRLEETRGSSSSIARESRELIMTRELGPKILCFLVRDASGALTYRTRIVREYMEETGIEAEPNYVFLSYTRKQFCVATVAELGTWDVTEEKRGSLMSYSTVDRAKLGEYGIRAAQKANVPAFWLDFECLQPVLADGETPENMADVYRICDIVRTAQSVFIIRGPSLDNRSEPPSPASKGRWLHEWGSRLWTVPEALLCPSKEIDVYTEGDSESPEVVPKRRLAARAWKDASNMRQLMDHFESSLHLTPLELVSIALEVLSWRKTDMHKPGDASYALMGLLRRRPQVNPKDSDFAAFARLSLANDSDQLLERLLCMHPTSPDAHWSKVEDIWGSRLWDIEPHCQIAGIVDNRTVKLDGAYGAAICWYRLPPVAFFKRQTIMRTVGKVLLRAIPVYLIAGLATLILGAIVSQGSNYYGYSSATSPILYVGILITILVMILVFISPVWLLNLYRGKFWSTQAWFLGIAGVPDLGRVEECIFGMNGGRLQWSTDGSPLSRHRPHNGEKRPLPPAHDPSETRKLFTVIDTFTMTATAFYAERPPSVVMVCGREGGMQRAILCSYDWKTQTFCKEAVLRMKTLVLERMSRVDRFRFCLDRNGRQAEELH